MLSKIVMIILALSLSVICTAEAVSIIDIQKTADPGIDYTYPSLYEGKSVTVEGIVTSAASKGSFIYVSDPKGGSWSGIAVDASGSKSNVSMRDRISITGVVRERFGMTVITEIQDIQVLSSHNSLPAPIAVTAYELTKDESLESSLVTLKNNTVVNSADSRILVKDSSGECTIRNSLVDFSSFAGKLKRNSDITVSGIVTYTYGEFSLQPRYITDISVNRVVGSNRSSWGRVKSLYR